MQKNPDVFKEDFSNFWVISRLFVFNEWKEIAKFLEDYFNLKFNINPLFADKAWVKVDQGQLENLIEAPVNGKI